MNPYGIRVPIEVHKKSGTIQERANYIQEIEDLHLLLSALQTPRYWLEFLLELTNHILSNPNYREVSFKGLDHASARKKQLEKDLLSNQIDQVEILRQIEEQKGGKDGVC